MIGSVRKRLAIALIATGVAAAGALAVFGVLQFTRKTVDSFRLVHFPSSAMESTIRQGSVVRVDTTAYQEAPPKVGEIIAFKAPSIEEIPAATSVFVMRCVGAAGDIIEVRNGHMFRNGIQIEERYVRGKMERDFKLVLRNSKPFPVCIEGQFVNLGPNTAAQFAIEDMGEMDRLRQLKPIPVPNGFLLVMGDKRNAAFDSRAWGLLPTANVLGKVLLIE